MNDNIFQKHKVFFMAVREALLSLVDAIEKEVGMFPTTADIRREHKRKALSQMDTKT